MTPLDYHRIAALIDDPTIVVTNANFDPEERTSLVLMKGDCWATLVPWMIDEAAQQGYHTLEDLAVWCRERFDETASVDLDDELVVHSP